MFRVHCKEVAVAAEVPEAALETEARYRASGTQKSQRPQSKSWFTFSIGTLFHKLFTTLMEEDFAKRTHLSEKSLTDHSSLSLDSLPAASNLLHTWANNTLPS